MIHLVALLQQGGKPLYLRLFLLPRPIQRLAQISASSARLSGVTIPSFPIIVRRRIRSSRWTTSSLAARYLISPILNLPDRLQGLADLSTFFLQHRLKIGPIGIK